MMYAQRLSILWKVDTITETKRREILQQTKAFNSLKVFMMKRQKRMENAGEISSLRNGQQKGNKRGSRESFKAFFFSYYIQKGRKTL